MCLVGSRNKTKKCCFWETLLWICRYCTSNIWNGERWNIISICSGSQCTGPLDYITHAGQSCSGLVLISELVFLLCIVQLGLHFCFPIVLFKAFGHSIKTCTLIKTAFTILHSQGTANEMVGPCHSHSALKGHTYFEASAKGNDWRGFI